MVSRRLAVGSSALALLVVLSRSAFGAEQGKEVDRDHKTGDTGALGRAREGMGPSERMRNAGSMEELLRMMQERTVLRHQQALEDLKHQLRVSGQEWTVIKPRLEARPERGQSSDFSIDFPGED